MTSGEGKKEKINEPSEQALLTEYQVCQRDQNSEVQSFWTLAGIFIGFTSVLLGGLIYGVLSNCQLFKTILEPAPKSKELLILGIVSWVLSMAVIIILAFLWGWLKRVRFLSQLNFKRMREIELKLGMRQSWLIDTIDKKCECEKWEEKLEKYSNDDARKQELKKALKEFISKHKDQIVNTYERSSGRWHHRWIFGTLFFMWGLLFVASIYLLNQYACCVAASFAAIGVIFWLFILLWEERKRRKHCNRSKLETI